MLPRHPSTSSTVFLTAVIIATAVRDVTREIGDLVTDGIEMREASRRAQRDNRSFEVIDGEFEQVAEK